MAGAGASNMQQVEYKAAEGGEPAGFRDRVVKGVTVERRQLLAEVSGALGDLGTYVPIAITLALVNGLDLGTTLIFNGAFNVLTGLLFGVPMPVQPMKSIAAAAISDKFSVQEIMAAGLTVSFILVALGVTGLMTLVNWLVPLPVVRGIQLAQGLTFSLTAVKYILNTQNFAKGKAGANRPWEGSDGRILAIFAFLFVIVVSGVGGDGGAKSCKLTSSSSGPAADHDDLEEQQQLDDGSKKQKGAKSLGARLTAKVQALDAKLFPAAPASSSGDTGRYGNLVVPSGLIIFLVGVVLAFIRRPSTWDALTVGPSTPQVEHISGAEWKTGFIKGAIPQLPLSVLNSVIAVVKLSRDLFPDHTHVTVMHVATSVGMMNIVGCWFGAMPVCHGCGGLAGQYRFGARSGLSVVMLGAAKIALGLLLGSSIVKLLQAFPVALLGVLLLYAGIELAMSARDMASRADSFVVLVVTAVALAWSNAAYGFLCGMGVALVMKLRTFDFRALSGSGSSTSNKPVAADPY